MTNWDRHMRDSLDRWLTTPPEERYGPRVKTLGEFIKELQELAEEHGGDIPVFNESSEDVYAEYNDDDEEYGPGILVS